MEGALSILSPLDGDMLHERDGRLSGESLYIPVRVSAPPGSKVVINNVDAIFANGEYTAEIPLCGCQNVIQARDEGSGCSQSIAVYRLKSFAGRYRLSLDDNIWFLQDIARNAGQYRSIFENPYLGFFKQVHDGYGTKVHVNVYYQTQGFNLSQMPGKFKGEWQDNAGWLRLSFHALQNDPDMPYKTAGYAEVKRDCEMVLEQVRRFAGGELLGPVTTLHWGEAAVEGCRALRDCGCRCLVGYFNVDDDLPPVSYYLDVAQRRHIKKRAIWKDNREDIVFFRSAMVLDRHRQEDIPTYMDGVLQDPLRSAFVDFLIHEQYFYPHYTAYQPDYRQKVLAAARWADANGYKPSFLGECLPEGL